MFWNNNGQAMIVGRNQDIGVDDQAAFYVMPAGIYRKGGTQDNPADWTSTYGSLVVNVTYSGDLTGIEGVNTAGLCVNGLAFIGAVYPDQGSRKGVIQPLFLQYLLDNAANVTEALALCYDTACVLTAGGIPAHMSIQDATGDSAIVEFVPVAPDSKVGEIKVYHGASTNVMANQPSYNQMLASLANYKYFGAGTLPLPGDNDSESRFVRATAWVGTLNDARFTTACKPDLAAIMLTAMRNLTEPFGTFEPYGGAYIFAWPTLWTSVYDLTNMKAWVGHNVAKTCYWIDMKKLHFQKGAPILTLKLDRPDLAGEVSSLFGAPSPAIPMLLLSD